MRLRSKAAMARRCSAYAARRSSVSGIPASATASRARSSCATAMNCGSYTCPSFSRAARAREVGNGLVRIVFVGAALVEAAVGAAAFIQVRGERRDGASECLEEIIARMFDQSEHDLDLLQGEPGDIRKGANYAQTTQVFQAVVSLSRTDHGTRHEHVLAKEVLDRRPARSAGSVGWWHRPAASAEGWPGTEFRLDGRLGCARVFSRRLSLNTVQHKHQRMQHKHQKQKEEW